MVLSTLVQPKLSHQVSLLPVDPQAISVLRGRILRFETSCQTGRAKGSSSFGSQDVTRGGVCDLRRLINARLEFGRVNMAISSQQGKWLLCSVALQRSLCSHEMQQTFLAVKSARRLADMSTIRRGVYRPTGWIDRLIPCLRSTYIHCVQCTSHFNTKHKPQYV